MPDNGVQLPTAPQWVYRRGLFRFGLWRRFVRRWEATLFYAWWRWGDKW